MRAYIFTPICYVYFVCHVPTLTAAFEIKNFPDCAVQCINTTLSINTHCASSQDTSCLCSDPTVRLTVAQCFSTTCTPKQVLTSLNATASTCGDPVRNKSHYARVFNIVFIVVTMCIVVARYAAQAAYGRFHLPSDVNMVFIVALNIALTWVCDHMYRTGLGRDIWTLPFHDITELIKSYWICELLYFTLTWLIRIAFVLFFFQIFVETRFRKILSAVIGVYILAMVSGILTVSFICTPVSYLWNSWDGEHKGHCLDHNAAVFAQAALSIVADIVTLALAISQVRNLQMSMKKKIGVMIMFSLGTLTTVVAAIRLKSLVKFATTPNPTWDYLSAGLWSIVEYQVGVICLCMPSIRLGLARLLPKAMGSSRKNGASSSHGSGQVFDGYGNGKSRAFTSSRVNPAKADDTESVVQLVDLDTKGPARGSTP
ncbi:hypothetical protein FB567DRAFT_465162 [Paraphoma chrysanthemicola]|uniref:CFEM domain-containing protein n=1 Tax=Paraphoma chrysanthemicola TaxID=798071 RepID=A0A8K0RF40_9PLEO|nr:hypothetical protein FB567DRAFT_465162 [Paraphoma chrysanthemicola]